jgi:hypothetical protein
MLDDVADVQTVARLARSPDTKGAIQYLQASGAVAISIVEVDGTVAFRIGKIDQRAVAIFWIMQSDAKPVVALARRKSTGNKVPVEALHQAATEKRATLTEHDTAMMRAGDAVRRLDSYIDGLRARG